MPNSGCRRGGEEALLDKYAAVLMRLSDKYSHPALTAEWVVITKGTQPIIMDFYKKYGLSGENRREELIRKIEAAVNNLTLEELEALHYDMITKNFIND